MAHTTDKKLSRNEARRRTGRTGIKSNPSRPASTQLAPSLLLSLQAFDAAVRLGSFKAAAEALRITPSAVSHRIRNLEQTLGDRLFERVHRAVLPTAAGKRLCARTSRAFGELARAAETEQADRPSRSLRINIIPLFGVAWLIPRIAQFLAQHPDIEMTIESSTRFVDFESEPFDAAIRVGDGDWPGLTAVRLMTLYTTPITQPALAQRLQLRTPEDLLSAPLIHVSGFPRIWHTWLEQAGVANPAPRSAIWVDTFDASFQAAEQGAGVALGVEPFFAEREAAGRVCRLLPLRQENQGCWLVYRTMDRRHAALRDFREWLLTELRRGG